MFIHEDPNVYVVNEKLIRPETYAVHCSWALKVHPMGKRIKWFVTHAWAEGVKEFCESVLSCDFIDEDDGLFICFLSNPQTWPKKSLDQLLNVGNPSASPFAVALTAATGVLVVRNTRTNLYARLWCVYELFLAKEEDKPIHVRGVMPALTEPKISRGLGADARCSSPQDTKMLRSVIKRKKDQVNNVVLQIMKAKTGEIVGAVGEEAGVSSQGSTIDTGFLCRDAVISQIPPWSQLVFIDPKPGRAHSHTEFGELLTACHGDAEGLFLSNFTPNAQGLLADDEVKRFLKRTTYNLKVLQDAAIGFLQQFGSCGVLGLTITSPPLLVGLRFCIPFKLTPHGSEFPEVSICRRQEGSPKNAKKVEFSDARLWNGQTMHANKVLARLARVTGMAKPSNYSIYLPGDSTICKQHAKFRFRYNRKIAHEPALDPFSLQFSLEDSGSKSGTRIYRCYAAFGMPEAIVQKLEMTQLDAVPRQLRLKLKLTRTDRSGKPCSPYAVVVWQQPKKEDAYALQKQWYVHELKPCDASGANAIPLKRLDVLAFGQHFESVLDFVSRPSWESLRSLYGCAGFLKSSPFDVHGERNYVPTSKDLWESRIQKSEHSSLFEQWTPISDPVLTARLGKLADDLQHRDRAYCITNRWGDPDYE